MITSFTVAGVEVNPLLETLDIRETVGGTSTLSCVIGSIGSPVQRYSVFDEVIVEEDGVRIYAGNVTQALEKGWGGPNLYDEDGAPEIVTEITCEDFNSYAERITLTETVTAGTTLKAVLTMIVADYLDTFGVTLDPAQAVGPTLQEIKFDLTRVNDALNSLAQATGYLWRIDYDRQLRMWLPGDLTAPFNIDEFDDPARWTGDVEVNTILGDGYANRVTVVSGQITIPNQTDSLVGTGLTNILVTTYPILKHNRFVIVTPGFYEPLGDGHPTGPTWTIGTDNRTLTRLTGNLPIGFTANVTYDGILELSQTAEDPGEIAAHGLYELVVKNTEIRTDAAALELAQQILAERLHAIDQVVTYQTRETAPTLRAGQQQTLAATARDISGAFIIRDLSIRAEVPATADGWLIRSVTAKAFEVLAGKWQHTYRDWLLQGGGGTVEAAAVQSPAPLQGGGPAPPLESVQFNRDGGFGGNAHFLFHEDETTVGIGTDHTPGGADNLLVGEGHTVN